MSRRLPIAGILALLFIVSMAIPAAAATPTARRAVDAAAFHDRLIVTWKSAPPRGLAIAGVRSVEGTARPMRTLVKARSGMVADVAARLRSDPRVLSVVPDAAFKLADWPATGTPTDPLYADQPDLVQIGVTEAWKTTLGDPSVVVAVLDSGVDLTHPDLDGVTVVAPRDMIWNNSDVTDELGHGTHVSGTIIAETDNADRHRRYRAGRHPDARQGRRRRWLDLPLGRPRWRGLGPRARRRHPQHELRGDAVAGAGRPRAADLHRRP